MMYVLGPAAASRAWLRRSVEEGKEWTGRNAATCYDWF
jgi:hypothetical protein